jgi:hypothetical protein
LEEGSNKKVGLKAVIEHLPGWIQMLVVIGSMVFSMGVLYNRVNNLEGRVNTQESYPAEIGRLQIQIEQANKAQEQTNESVNKLADAVNNLSVSVAKLQGQMDTKTRR